MKVIFSDASRADLRAIVQWIGTDYPARAESFAAELLRACQSLARHPARFPLVRGTSREGLRKRNHGNYLIFYRISPNAVEIGRIVHGSRDWAALLGLAERAKTD